MRHRYNRWGATSAELTATMPGDELVPAPRLGYTRAISIAAPVADVWPWLVQIGHGRGGLYSFDGLENLARCDIHSADRILDEHQALNPGDLIRLGPEGYPCFQVWRATTPTDLVLIGADPKPPHTVPPIDSPGGRATWQWALRPTPDGLGTRVIVRQRLTYPKSQSVMWHIVEPIGFVMERQMLLGLRQRATGHRGSGHRGNGHSVPGRHSTSR
jgi:hypothetical protein